MAIPINGIKWICLQHISKTQILHNLFKILCNIILDHLVTKYISFQILDKTMSFDIK